MSILYPVLAGLLSVAAFSQPACSQGTSPGPLLTAATAAAQQEYTEAFRGNSQLVSGPEYVDYSLRYHVRNGHPFFLTSEKQAGNFRVRVPFCKKLKV